MNDTGPKVTAADIETMESKLEGRLPASYRRFLLRYNGGVPDPHHFRDEALSRFYSVRAPDKSNDLLANHRRMRKWLPVAGHPDLTLIAQSFDEFLDSFHDIDEAELEARAKAIHAKNADFAAKRRAVLEDLVSSTSDPDDKPAAAKTKPTAQKRAPRDRRTK